MVENIAELILKYSTKLSVPPIAIAGALADEYNTRFMPDYSLVKKQLDYVQDVVTPKGMYTEFSESINNELSSKELDEQYRSMKGIYPDNIRMSKWNRFSNVVAGDYGKGNISLRTAFDMYDEKFDDFPKMSRLDLLRYLITDEGTVHFAALYIKKSQMIMSEYLSVLPPRKQEAV
ncbi:hypothetical protein [Citrobacter portucalensis]|uniref:hypothetical protein n=1 Tax=Citrobacter portucalensis TaxID=1639133 RepID=UPI0028892D20|nr:hypothetical protein [Citrobacter portucalensis]WNI83998.1 hypothetical protein RIK60_00400 [Citrobacter portucalensis]